MKRILILIIGLIGVSYGQSSPTSAKTRFVNGIYLGTKLDSYFAAADSNAIYWRADSALMAKYKGAARALAFDVTGGYKPMSDTFFTNGYTTRARTKQQIDSLSNAVANGFVTLGTIQTITAQKTFSSSILNTGGFISTSAASNPTLRISNTTSGVSWDIFNNSSSNLVFNNGAGSGVSFGSSSDITALSYKVTGGTSSQFLKADGSVDGTAYATAASLSGYLPLSGGTLTGALNGTTARFLSGSSTEAVIVGGAGGAGSTRQGQLKFGDAGTVYKIQGGEDYSAINFIIGAGTPLSIASNSVSTFSGQINGTSLSMSGNILTNGEFRVDPSSGDGILRMYTAGTERAAVRANSTKLYFEVAGVERLGINASTGAATFTGTLSGTSLSMSGGGSFGGTVSTTVAGANAAYFSSSNGSTTSGAILIGANAGGDFNLFNPNATPTRFFTNGTEYGRFASDGTLLINTTTTDGTNKLIVNGGVKANNVYLGTSSFLTSTSANIFQVGDRGVIENVVGNQMMVSNNAYYDGSNWKYISTAPASAIRFGSTVQGDISFHSAASGTAGTNITNWDGTDVKLYIAPSGAATFSSSVYGQGYRFAYAAKSSNYTLTDNDDYINVTSSCTITLPTAVGRSGKRYVIKCTGSAVATIASTSSQTIDGNTASTYTFGGPNFNIMIVYSDGSNWFLEAWQTGI